MKKLSSVLSLVLLSQFIFGQSVIQHQITKPLNVQSVKGKQKQTTTVKSLNNAAINGQKLKSEVVLFDSNYWNEISESSINSLGKREIFPLKYKTVELNINKLKQDLIPAVLKSVTNAKGVIIDLPDPDGGTSKYIVYKNTTMSPGYQDKFPQIRTYDAISIDNKGEHGKIDVTQRGFHAMIFSPKRTTFFIDPYQREDVKHYLVYYKKDFKTNQTIDCGVKGIADDIHDGKKFKGPNDKTLGTCDLRTYRLALAATGEYTQYHGGTVPGAAAAQVTSMNRVNGIFERDAAITMTIIAGNNAIIYTNGATDPYTNNNGAVMLGENQTNIDAVIGSANYDIGHVFSTGGGGIAQLFSPCTGNKARGVTGSAAPVNDPFDVDYVAHEMGHQWGANHTQNNNCNRNNATAMEPGSASTIMGYAGICPPNVQNNSDDHFHGINVEEWSNFIDGFGSSCAVTTPLVNSSPTITGTNAAGITIPANTPFALTAFATDPDGDVLTFCWEQMDNQVTTQPPQATATGGPNFRSYSPTTDSTRYFPSLTSLMAGGPFTWEVLPSVTRTMNFRTTVRDNSPGGGCVDNIDISIDIDAGSGPFVVTYPSATGITWTGATSETVTWNVANTDNAPVSCANVDILLSTDGGLTFPTVLASGVPNDGSQTVTVPNTPTTTAVIMVICSNGTFFDISDNVFTIVASTFDYTLSSNPTSISICPPNDAVYTIDVGSIGGYNDPVTLSVSGLPGAATGTFAANPVVPVGSTTLTISNTGSVTPGTYSITVSGNSTSGSKSISITLIVSDPAPSAVTLTSPANLATGVPMPVNFSWTAAAGAGVLYDIDIATDVAFTAIVDNAVGLGTNSYTSFALSPTTTYYWRVRAYNGCGSAPFSSTFEFETGIAAGCDTLNFPPPGTLTIYGGAGVGGYVCGWNTLYQDVSKAEYFSAASHAPFTHVTGGLFYIWSAADGGNGATVDFNVWDATGAGGSPGAVLGTVTVPLAALNTNPAGAENQIFEIIFPTPVNVGAADFYFGVNMNGFAAGDSLGFVSNTDGDTSPATAWEEWGAGAGGGWYAFDDGSSWGLDISQFMSPYMTDVPPTANITPSTTTVCEGDTINFDGTSSTNAAGYNWTFNGGTPASSTNSVETVTYNTSGNYTEYLVVDGACQSIAIDSVSVTVNPSEDPAFSYSSSLYCTSDADPTPTITGTTGGTFTSSPAGLTINSSTGTIDISASTPNTYSVLYTTPGPSCPDTMSVLVTISISEDATFSYSAGNYCQSDVDPTPTISGTSGGAFTSTPAGLNINGGTGTIDLSASTPNTYTVTYTTAGICPDTMDVMVTINADEDATFSYSAASYCQSEADPIPTISGTSGGAFTSTPAGLNINGGTGTIDLSTSTPNTYTVTYTTTGACPDTMDVTVTINANEDATFSYSAGNYCQSDVDPIPTISGTAGGAFTSTPAGLNINGGTGAIDLSASTPNTYTVTYTTAGICPDTMDVMVTINADEDATFNYSAASYCQSEADPIPTISGTSGGAFTSTPAGLNINGGTGAIDLSASTPNTYTVTYTTTGACPDTMDVTVTINADEDATFSYSASTYCVTGTDPTPTISGTPGGAFTSTPAGLNINGSTGTIDLSASAPNSYTVTYITPGPTCPDTLDIVIDIILAPNTSFSYVGTPYCGGSGTASVTYAPGATGGVFTATPTGLSINSSNGDVDLALSTPGTYTVKNLIAATGGCSADSSTSSITIIAPDTAAFSYSSSSYCQSDMDPIPTNTSTNTGAYTSSPIGLVINSVTGTIDLSASTPNTYTVTYTTTGACPDTMDVTVTINADEDATFSYSAGNYCQSDVDPTPTISGTSGGAFTSTPAGLNINGGTGAIDLSASTPNTYTVTYTTAGICPDTMDVMVTINADEDATFSYSSASYCQSETDPTPTISGTSGGAFTSTPAGLNINGGTGAIDLSASTPNTYTVTYTTAGICPDTMDVMVTINANEDATFSYSAGNYCQSDVDPIPTISGTAGGAFTSSPAGLNINAGTGTIDLSASTPNTYTVTYTTTGACPDTMDVMVTINADEDATFSYSAASYCQSEADPIPTISGTSGGAFTSTPAGLNINGGTGTIDLSASTPGTYSILYTTPGPNCVDTMSVNITINNCSTPPVAGFSASDSTLCIGDCISFTDLSTNSPTNWTWYFFGASTSNSNQQNPTNICYNSAGSFDVALVVSNSGGQDSLFMSGFITVNSDPTVVANATSAAVCDGDSVTLTGSGAVNYNWNNGVTDGVPFVPTATNTYNVTGTDANGCSNSDMITVTVNALPTIVASNDTAICVGEEVMISASGGATYIWSNGVNGQSQIVSPGSSTSYIVTGSDGNGCSSTDDVMVEIDNSKCFNIPNVFSPNGDGKNDTWVIRGIEEYPDIVVTIFNRWGGEMYKSNGYDEPWDGTYNGTDSPSATYYYIIDLGNGKEPISGTVNIIR